MQNKKQKTQSRYRFFVGHKNFLTCAAVLLISLLTTCASQAAYVLDNDAGTYTDDFANNTGVPTRSYVNVNTATGVLQLTSAASQTTFTTPYAVSGNAITRIIKPVLIAEWGIINISATVPSNTTLKVQILDDTNNPWTDDVIAGNFEGIDLSETTEIDLSDIPVLYCAKVENTSWGGEFNCDKITSIKIKFTITTTDTVVTPSVNGMSMNWTKKQGDFVAAEVSVEDPWPTDFGNQQRTLSSNYYNLETYPVFKWASERHSGDPYYASIYVLKDKILGYTYNSEGRLFSLNRNTGEEHWKIPAIYVTNAPGMVTSDGTFYGHNVNVDNANAIDAETGEIKWVYNWMGGHGGAVVVGAGGKIYYIRDESNSQNATLVEQNPDGLITSQTVLNVVPEGLAGENKSVSSMSLRNDNIAYFVTSVYNSSTYASTDKGRIFAINLDTKEIVWSYIGEFEPHVVIDSKGSAYLFSKRIFGEITTKKVVAINSNGTLKWERDGGSDDGSGYYSYGAILREDGKLMVSRTIDSATYESVVEVIDSSNGSLISSEGDMSITFADGANGYYYGSRKTIDAENYCYSTQMNYADSENKLKWKISYAYTGRTTDRSIGHSLSKMVPDERGWVYGGFIKSAYELPSYNRLRSETFTKTYALAPWTLSDHSNISGEKKPGDVLDFSVKTSMLLENPLFGGENKVQVAMSNGDNVLLTYASTDSTGNTIWTGSYTIPQDFPEGEVNYTIEASQAHLETDIPTHFDSAPTESNNTGIIIAKGFINDSTSPSNKLSKLSIKAGDKKIDFRKNSKNYVKEKSFKLSGINEEAKNGQIKIYKKNSKGSKDKVTSTDIDENGKWNYDFKKEKDGKDTYYIKTIDSAGNEASFNSFDIIRDTSDPKFISFPESATYNKWSKLSFPAVDAETEIDYYKVKVLDSNGHILRGWKEQSVDFYLIPDQIKAEAKTVIVRAYDKAGNNGEIKFAVGQVADSSLQTESSTDEETEKQFSGAETEIQETKNNSISQTSDKTQENLEDRLNAEKQEPQSPANDGAKWWNPLSWF